MARRSAVEHQLLHVRHHGTPRWPISHRRVGSAERLVGGLRLVRDHDLLGGRLTPAGYLTAGSQAERCASYVEIEDWWRSTSPISSRPPSMFSRAKASISNR